MAGYWRPGRVWALCGLCLVACLNPMPDDFPNQNDRDGALPGGSENTTDNAPAAPGAPQEPGESEAPPLEEGPVFVVPGDVPAGSAGSGGGTGADAGAPESDAGP
jgi:hypothetical protein